MRALFLEHLPIKVVALILAVVNGKLLLFLRNDNIDALEKWEQGDEVDNLRRADAHWRKVSGM